MNSPAPFVNFRVSAVVRRFDGAILLCKFHALPFWMLPGGKVIPGEPAREALVRELREEIGCAAPMIGDYLGTIENFFVIDHRRVHEVALYFSVAASDIGQGDEFPGAEAQLVMRWVHLEALEATDLRPALLKQLLAADGAPSFGYQLTGYPIDD